MNLLERKPVKRLGACIHPSPQKWNTTPGDSIGDFVPEEVWVRYSVEEGGPAHGKPWLFEKAGPREKLFFDPSAVRAAIVTCGGLSPGLNNVIRSAVREWSNYGVQDILGIRNGYLGMNPASGLKPVRLDDEVVDDIHRVGGTYLGSSRGNQPVEIMVNFLEEQRVNILLAIGGDGTQRGAHEIAVAAQKRNMPLAVVGVPKTVDNDILFVQKTFGFSSAVDRARDVLQCAHAEAKAYPNGVALVRLMGRDSGFIAAVATLASQEVNFTLIPESPFHLEGEHGLLAALERRLEKKNHAVIVVAEGAGQEHLRGAAQRDASGNVLHADIGIYLRDRIVAHFQQRRRPVSMKYMDPSYIIRSVPANSEDAWLCDQYARNAVHAAMAGRTDTLIGWWNQFIHVPIPMATEYRHKIEPESHLWSSVLASTRQPPLR